jgi:hypothetical protein
VPVLGPLRTRRVHETELTPTPEVSSEQAEQLRYHFKVITGDLKAKERPVKNEGGGTTGGAGGEQSNLYQWWRPKG